jgi:hypothetical protein
MPALPLDEAGKYVAGAYVAFLALVLIYVGIMAAKLQRINRELGELAELTERRPAANPDGAEAGADQSARGEAAGIPAHPVGPGRGAEEPTGIGSSSRQEAL